MKRYEKIQNTHNSKLSLKTIKKIIDILLVLFGFEKYNFDTQTNQYWFSIDSV